MALVHFSCFRLFNLGGFRRNEVESLECYKLGLPSMGRMVGLCYYGPPTQLPWAENLYVLSGDDLSLEKHGLWLQEQKSRVARLQKHLKSRWTLEDLIQQHLHMYHAHFNRALVSARLQDVAQLLMPQWAPPHELASLAWLGDWRPSAILGLIWARARTSPSLSGSDPAIQRLLPQLIHELRIEETVVEEEMAEIQATCVLHLPFAPMNHRTGGAALRCIQSEFKKIHQVIVKAQSLRSIFTLSSTLTNITDNVTVITVITVMTAWNENDDRFKALEMVVNNVLSQTDAAEFLVAFAGIQKSIHQFAAHQRLRKGQLSVCVKAVGNSQSWVIGECRYYKALKFWILKF